MSECRKQYVGTTEKYKQNNYIYGMELGMVGKKFHLEGKICETFNWCIRASFFVTCCKEKFVTECQNDAPAHLKVVWPAV